MPPPITNATATAPLEQPAYPPNSRWHTVAAARFLVALILLLVASPLAKEFQIGDLIEAVMMTVVMFTGIVAVGSRRITIVLACLLVTPAILGKWINHFWPEHCPAAVSLVPGMAFLGLVIFCLLGSVMRARRVDAGVLCTGISIYLLLGVLWMFAYLLVNHLVPAAFAMNGSTADSARMTGFDACYFSFATLTTVGYGDIAPVASIARMLAMLEAMTGTLFVGVMIARLVCLYSALGLPSGLDSSEKKSLEGNPYERGTTTS